ncbi:MAG: GNAT family N-acetyltransferase [Bacilli bacterium]|nr:GNAT family N-acetyltransferase [Bacilli bacterium]
MPKITLEPITEENFNAIIKMSDTLDDYQKKCVAPNVISLAQAYVNYDRAWPRAICLDQKPIGFVMLALHDDDIPDQDQPAYYLWRFMMTREYQHQGFGRQVLDLLVEKCQEEGVKTFYTSCEMEKDEPYRFYMNYGFEDTHKMDDGEEILRMVIPKKG